MRILLLEMKRVIKSRMTWILLVIAVAMSVIISYQTISGAQYNYTNQSGQQEKITGMEAIHANKKRMQPYEGVVTEAKLQKALKTFQQQHYNKNQTGTGGSTVSLSGLYYEKIAPIQYFLDMINGAYPGGEDEFESLNKVNANNLTDFYRQRSKTLISQLKAQYPGNQNVINEVQKLNNKVKTPFFLKDGYLSDNSVDLCILIFLLVLISAMIVTPIFSAEYQDCSDDILRCTKNGRTKLAIAKLCSSLLIIFAMFAICILIFVLAVDSAYGWDSLQTSIQIMSVLSFVPLTVGQEQGVTILAGLLTLLAAACFALFFSAKCQHPTTALIIAIAFCILPAILHSLGHGNIINLLTCVLPTGGAGISHNFFNQLNQSTFVKIGSFDIWAPYLTIGAAAVEIPLFFILSVHTYCKHQVT